jgi:hypothetical protein
MAVQAISCGECAWPLTAELWNREPAPRCPGCGQRVRAAVFPAIEQKRSGTLPETLGAETEASCFYHPQSRAMVPCEECGRFLCGLCDLEVDGRHLCPACFKAGLNTLTLETVETRRTMYDSVALAFSTLPALLFWPVVFTAPAALFLVIRRWRSPGSIVPRTRVRFYLAALFALVEIAGFAAILWVIFRVPRQTLR